MSADLRRALFQLSRRVETIEANGGSGGVSLATVQSEIATHNADTTNVHGITDTSSLGGGGVSLATVQSEIATHAADTTSVHGIADTTALLTTTAADAAYLPRAAPALTNYLDAPNIATPATPSANVLRHFSRNRAGRMVPMVLGPAGLDTALQAAFWGNNISMWLPGNGTTASIAFGNNWTVIATQNAAATLATTNILTAMKRATYTTTTVSGNASGVRSSSPVCWRGNAAGLGGWFAFWRFGVATYHSAMQILAGLTGLNGTLAGEPSAQNNTIGVGKDSTDTNWQVITRSATTTSKIDTGVAVAANEVFDLLMFAAPNGSTVTVRLVNVGTGAVLVDNTVVSANLPVNTTFLNAHFQVRTTAAVQVVGALNRIYIETDT